MSGCTAFLVNMMGAPSHKLVKADPAKLAAKYDLSKWPWGEGWVRMSLEHWRQRGSGGVGNG
jgi:hypothetical protein